MLHRLTEAEMVLPEYGANTIANIPATVARFFGVESPGLPPLRADLWQPILAQGPVERVVLILADGMGRNMMRAFANETAWLEAEATVAGAITSVFPSTTVNALSCLWTGAGPAQHGLVGLELFFPQLAVMGQMLTLTPSFAYWPDALTKGGVDPYNFLPVPGIAQALAQAGVDTFNVKHSSLVNTTLSKMHGRGVAKGYGIVTAADMMWRIRQIIEERKGQRSYIAAYWAALDTLSHEYGHDHEAVAAELSSFLHLLKKELLHRLSPAARRGTLVILTADHGQITTPRKQCIFIEDHPQLQQLLLMRTAGEPRAPYLYARQGEKQAVMDYVAQHLGHAMVALDAQDALQHGLFGPAPHTVEVAQRIGDVILMPRGGHALVSQQSDQFITDFSSRHGGLSRDEMEVPFYGFYLS